MSLRNGSRRLLTRMFFSGICKFAAGQGGEGGGAATEKQSSSFGRKHAGGDKQMIRKSEIGNCNW